MGRGIETVIKLTRLFVGPLVAMSSIAIFAPFSSAQAQELTPFGGWGGDGYSRRDYRYERPAYRHAPPRRYDYRYRRYNDYYEDYDDDGWDRPRRRETMRERRRDNDRNNDDDDNFNLQEEDVRSGGARPAIAAVAPPIVKFAGPYQSGSIVIDSGSRKLYYVLNDASAYAYPIGVGREGFSWTGSETVSRVADWPDWHPPKEMRERQPELPTKMLGGINNPLGAKAIYLGNTLYRIHGTNDARSIGRAQSSGCFRMMNGHVLHLASLVQVGTPVSVVATLQLAGTPGRKLPPVQNAFDEDDEPPMVARRRVPDSYDEDDDVARVR
jgi:lipoprotein-anchoring transpeptidase ErfK/SrfK